MLANPFWYRCSSSTYWIHGSQRRCKKACNQAVPGASRAGFCSGVGGRLLRGTGDAKAHEKKAETFTEGIEEVHVVSAIKHSACRSGVSAARGSTMFEHLLNFLIALLIVGAFLVRRFRGGGMIRGFGGRSGGTIQDVKNSRGHGFIGVGQEETDLPHLRVA